MKKLSLLLLGLTLGFLPSLAGAEEISFKSARLKDLSAFTDNVPTEVKLDRLLNLQMRSFNREWSDGDFVTTWIGDVVRVKNSFAVFTTVNDVTVGTLRMGGMGFTILPDGRVIQSEPFTCGTPTPQYQISLDLILDAAQFKAEPSPIAKPAEIKVGMPFSVAAAKAVGGHPAMRALIRNQEAVVNKALELSGLAGEVRVKFVGIKQVPYEETKPSRSLFNQVNEKNFKKYRNQYGADLVLVTVAQLPAGLGGTALQYSGKGEDAYGIVLWSQFANGVVVHEWGHLMNAHHPHGVLRCSTEQSRGFATIMFTGIAPSGCDAVHEIFFSNLGLYNLIPAGDSSHCNACRIKQVITTASKFRN